MANVNINNVNFSLMPLNATSTENLVIEVPIDKPAQTLKKVKILTSDKIFQIFSLTDLKYLSEENFDILINPGDSYEIPIRFQPKNEQFYSRKVFIEFEDEGENVKRNLTGRGYDNSYQQDPMKVVFNRNMLEVDLRIREDDGTVLEGEGFIDDVNPKIFWFFPKNRLKEKTTYIATIVRENTRSQEIFQMQQSFQWKFSTGNIEYPFIANRVPFVNQEDVFTDVSISVLFSEQMRHQSIEIKLFNDGTNTEINGSVSPLGVFRGTGDPNEEEIKPNKKGDFYWDEDTKDLYKSQSNAKDSWILVDDEKEGLKQFQFQPDSPLDNETLYRVEISVGCRAIRTTLEFPYGVQLKEKAIWKFKTVSV